MQEFKGTPAPWRAENSCVVLGDNLVLVACVHGGAVHGDDDIDCADARLIAAAPELLEALQAFEACKDLWLPLFADQEHIHEAECLHKLRRDGLAAIAKALNTDATER